MTELMAAAAQRKLSGGGSGAIWHLHEGADDVTGAEEDAGALKARARNRLDRLRLDDSDWNLEHVSFVRLKNFSAYRTKGLFTTEKF